MFEIFGIQIKSKAEKELERRDRELLERNLLDSRIRNGRICYAKLMERLKSDTVKQARLKREKKAARMRELCGIKVNRKHMGIVDDSEFEAPAASAVPDQGE